MTALRDERSLGELFGELSQQTSTPVAKEIQLARDEVTRSMTGMARNAATIAVGGAVAKGSRRTGSHPFLMSSGAQSL